MTIGGMDLFTMSDWKGCFTAAAIALPVLLGGCATGGKSWYDRHCEGKGHVPGTESFERCKTETRAWMERTQREVEAMRPSGPR